MMGTRLSAVSLWLYETSTMLDLPIMAKGTQPKDFLWYAVIVVVASPVMLLFDHFGMPEFERPAAFALGLLLLVVKVCRDARGRLWFWITIIAIAALHVPLLMLTAVRLTGAPFTEMLLLGIVDGAVMLAIIGLIEKLIGSKPESDVRPVREPLPKS